MSTIEITKRIFGMTQAEKTQKANERQAIVRVDGEFEDMNLEQNGKEQFNPSIFFLAMAAQNLRGIATF